MSSRHLAVGFAAGLITGAAALASATSYDRLVVFAEALARVEEHYVDDRDRQVLVYDAIGGLTQGLDDHSIFLDPERYRSMLEQTSGEYYGVGLIVEDRGGLLVVSTVADGSPAERVGLRVGDLLVAVGEARLEDLGLALVERLKGRRGTPVTLEVQRGEDRLTFKLHRDHVYTPSVGGRLAGGDVGWIRIQRFQRRTADEVRRTIAELREALGTRELRGLVLDLRGNPGGYLRQALAVADLWIAEGSLVKIISRDEGGRPSMARAAHTDDRLPLLVLVDGNSASASEVLAGALQDHRRAKVLGYPTYGKGSVQEFFELSDGSALKLTTARYFTPAGRNIQGSGIQPDLILGERGAWEPSFDLDAHLAGRDDQPRWVRDDPELHAAVLALIEPEEVESWFPTPPSEVGAEDFPADEGPEPR